MAKKPLRFEEIIDVAALRAGMDALAAKENLTADAGAMHTELVQFLKATLADGRTQAEEMLRADGSGLSCAMRLSHLMDEVIRALYDFTVSKIYPVHDRSAAEHMAVVAVGGYGRGTLAPASDVDLLFVLPWKQTPWGEQIVEYMLYLLWDLGLKVGHATRDIDECIRLSHADFTIRTAILETRFICGEQSLFDNLVERFDAEVVKDTGLEFVQAKLAERDTRHAKAGESRYLVEPDIKNGKGGLRDLQTLFWIGKYHYRLRKAEQLVGKGVFTRAEYNQFRKADDFLWAVRCHMHFLAGRAEERLHFDIQRDIAERLGYTSHPGLSAVERFMKHYFLVAKTIGDLTRIFCAALEEEQAKHVPGFSRIIQNPSLQPRQLAGAPGFTIDNQRLNVTDDQVFLRDPVNLLRLFWLADRRGLEFHPDALKLLTRSLRLVDRNLRRNPEANRLFMEVLTSDRTPELNLRRMNEAGLLGKLIPDFQKIVAMMQFNMYHHYTVDEHLIRCVGVLAQIEHGEAEDVHPLSHSLMPSLKDKRDILYVTVLFHDIAKGRPEDHSTAGAKIARRLCPPMGFSAADTATIAWLIEHHLLMSMTAQTRDLTDRKTIQDFADIVQSVERLKLLLILTVCDIRGVGPGVWNGWKGQLLRTLYYETELHLTGGFSELSHAVRAEAARAALADGLSDWDEVTRMRYLALPYENYLFTVPLEDQIRHMEMLRNADAAGRSLFTSMRAHQFEAVTEITVVSPDQPRLLSVIAGACAAAGANIVDAQIFTTADGRALDTILISREFELEEDENRRSRRVCEMIEATLSGEIGLQEMIAKRPRPKRGTKAFRVEPKAAIRNTLSNRFSVIEIECLDRPGLLSEITGALSDLSLNIVSAHISTFGEKVIDTFYVSDFAGQKIEEPARQEEVRETLIAVMQGRPLATPGTNPS